MSNDKTTTLEQTLREHKELCDQATPGPWSAEPDHNQELEIRQLHGASDTLNNREITRK